jgi:hypothetical protein
MSHNYNERSTIHWNTKGIVTFEVLMAMNTKIKVFWDDTV